VHDIHHVKNDLSENQVYRIDRYLAIGAAENVLVFRFANLMMEPLRNRNYVDHARITHSESFSVGTRGAYNLPASSTAETYAALTLLVGYWRCCDVLEGDRSLFFRYDEVGYAWWVVDPVLHAWGSEHDFIPTYAAGSAGPTDGERLFEPGLLAAQPASRQQFLIDDFFREQ